MKTSIKEEHMTVYKKERHVKKEGGIISSGLRKHHMCLLRKCDRKLRGF